MRRTPILLIPLLLLGLPLRAGEPSIRPVAAPPEPLRRSLGLAPFYARWVDARGFPVLGSERVSDHALREAAYLVETMLARRDDVRRAMIASRTRLAVMAVSERTTDVPEHADLMPKAYWDRRARGLGATEARPAVSCGEENLLGLPGDPYSTENILIHEFAHAMLQMGLARLEGDFPARLQAAYVRAIAAGLWEGTYAATDADEYWAEAVQSWFDTNREPDADHNHVNTREELKAYDPALAALVAEVFGDGPWRYRKPADRPEAGRAHLVGLDPARLGRFSWSGPEGDRP